MQGQKPEERFAAPGIDLQPQLQNDPIYTVASGFKRELCPMDVVCGWSMNHFNGRSLAFPPPAQLNLPSAAVFQGREGRGGRGEQIGEKAADGKNWSHLLIVGLTLSGKKTVDPLS